MKRSGGQLSIHEWDGVVTENFGVRKEQEKKYCDTIFLIDRHIVDKLQLFIVDEWKSLFNFTI